MKRSKFCFCQQKHTKCDFSVLLSHFLLRVECGAISFLARDLVITTCKIVNSSADKLQTKIQYTLILGVTRKSISDSKTRTVQKLLKILTYLIWSAPVLLILFPYAFVLFCFAFENQCFPSIFLKHTLSPVPTPSPAESGSPPVCGSSGPWWAEPECWWAKWSLSPQSRAPELNGRPWTKPIHKQSFTST